MCKRFSVFPSSIFNTEDFSFRPIDDTSPVVTIIEDDLNLEDLMRQKALLQARLGAYMSDTEGDDSRPNSVPKRAIAAPSSSAVTDTIEPLPGSDKIKKPPVVPLTLTKNNKNNIPKTSNDKMTEDENDVILLDDSSDGTPADRDSHRGRHSKERDRGNRTGRERLSSSSLTRDKCSRDYRESRVKQHSHAGESRIRSRSRSTSRRRGDHERYSRDRRRHPEAEEDRHRQRHRDHYDQNRQMEDLRQEINRDKQRETDVSRDRDSKPRGDRRQDDRHGVRDRGRERERDRDRDRWMRERSHSRSKAESDRKRERDRDRQRSGRDRGDRPDKDRYRGSLSEGQKVQQIDSSSDEEVNLDINMDEEDDEEKIIEMRRKQREELLKVFPVLVFMQH